MEIESFENKRLQVDRFFDGLSDDHSDGAPSLGCLIGDRGISETSSSSVKFSEDAPPSHTALVRGNASYTDESDHDISQLNLKEEASYNFCPHLDLVHVLCNFIIESDSIETQKKGAMELWLLMSYNLENGVKIARAGAIKPLISLISSSDGQLQEHSVTAILYLSFCDENKELLVSSGAIGPLVMALEVGTPKAKEMAAYTLFRLSKLKEEKTAIGRLGAIPLLVDLLETGSIQGKKFASMALFSLSFLKENKAPAVEAGIMKPLVELIMVDFKSNMVYITAMILRNLASLPEARAALVEGGGIPMLVEMVEVGSQKQKDIAVVILSRLCADSVVYCTMVARERPIPSLVALSKSGTKSAKQKVKALIKLLRQQSSGNPVANSDSLE